MVSSIKILKSYICNLWIAFKRLIFKVEKTCVKLSDIKNNTCRSYKYV